MDSTERRLRRLQHEMMDWCRNVEAAGTRRPACHRETINGDPEVWGDA